MYPIEKYRFIHCKTEDGNPKTIAITTFAGKTVRGVSICDNEDEYSEQYGNKLAAARANLKVCEKRLVRAANKVDEAEAMVKAAMKYRDEMNDYYNDSFAALQEAVEHINGFFEQSNT